MPNENTANAVEKSEVTPEKVASALNAATDANETSKEVLKSTQETNETLKSVAGSLAKLAELTEKSEANKEAKEESEAIKELKSELALVNAKITASKTGQIEGKSEEMTKKSSAFLKEFASATLQKSQVKYDARKQENKSSLFDDCGVLELKSLRTFDNSSAGSFVPNTRIIGSIDINKQTINPVTSVVSNISAGAIVAGNLGYDTYDESFVDTKESGEMVGKEESPNILRGQVKIYVTQEAAKIKISDKTLHATMGGELSTDPLLREVMAIERKYEKKIARKILNGTNEMGVYGIFNAAQKSGSKIKTLETATANIITLKDISSMCFNLKRTYLDNAVMLIDRAALYELYYDEGNDGHLKIEQFDYTNGIAALRTPERVIPLIGVDSSFLVTDISDNDGFANYTPFAGSVAANQLTGYTPSQFAGVSGATVNKGKVAAVLADFNQAYALARSSIVQTGVDTSFANILNDGFTWGGKIGYVGGKPVLEEAITLLTVK
jgi:HK97 family phage major capsid protein